MNVRVLVLLLLVVIACGGAYYLTVKPNQQSDDVDYVLLGELAQYATELESVTIENSQGILFSAKRDGQQWLGTHLDSLMTVPINREKLAQLVNTLSQARVLEAKTAKPEYYARLGVEGVDSANGQSTLLTLRTTNKQWSLLIGNIATSGLGHYAREPKQRRSYLINQVIDLPVSRADWLIPKVLDINSRDLTRVVMSGPDPIELHQDASGWQLTDRQGEEALVYPDVLNQLVNDLLGFNYSDIEPYTRVWQGLTPQHTIVINLKDSRSLRFALYRSEDSQDVAIYIDGTAAPEWVTNWVFIANQFEAGALLKQRQDLLRQ
jgi:predicted Rdx family selenoprotein